MGDGGSARLERNEVNIPVWVFVATTLFIWSTRVRNIVADDSLTGGDVWRSLVLPILFVTIAVCVGVLALSHPRRSTFSAAMRSVAMVVTAIWAVRSVMIAIADHAAGFIAVHAVLAAISVAIVWWAATQPTRTARESMQEVPGGVG